jgi:hypothetical protein
MHISRWPKSDTRWYLGVRCQRCRTPILFALDRSEGETEWRPPRKLFLTCPKLKCGHQGDYTSTRVARYQKKED